MYLLRWVRLGLDWSEMRWVVGQDWWGRQTSQVRSRTRTGLEPSSSMGLVGKDSPPKTVVSWCPSMELSGLTSHSGAPRVSSHLLRAQP